MRTRIMQAAPVWTIILVSLLSTLAPASSWGQTPTATAIPRGSIPHLLPVEKMCNTDADCDAHFVCEEHQFHGPPPFHTCTREWKRWDSPEITSIPCGHHEMDCGYSYQCIWLSNSPDEWRCGHIPEFVWPPGTPQPETVMGPEAPWFTSGGPLPDGIATTWELGKGPLPEAPKGYMWESAAVKANICGHCGLLCATKLGADVKTDFKAKFIYYLVPARWDCLEHNS